ncbi:MAG TPA: branched-chain amino acid aminotransferase [Catalimonadaceae bacterium]|nr:branched-chain amino acid aminotransferase [Catalimonadaceae bacterium]
MTDTFSYPVTRVAQSRISQVDFDNLRFGAAFADHMFVIDYKNGQWGQGEIVPYGPWSFDPSMAALHYGQAIFEGLKAYKTPEGNVQIFRPQANFERFNESAKRMSMPVIPEEIFMGGLTQLIKLDENWVPSQKGSSLYIRPFMVSTDEFLGVRIAETYRFAIICSPVGQYYSEPLKVKVERTFSRVAEGGSGNAKAAGNYAAAMYPTKLAQDAGFHQLLWTDAATHSFIEESGTMNVMFLIDDTVVTPSVGGTILKGVTRNSVLALAKDRGMKVDERRVSVEEIVAAAKDGRLKEAFGAGTAATIAPIAVIHCDGVDYHLPSNENRTFAPSILKELTEIRTGESADRFGWMVQV